MKTQKKILISILSILVLAIPGISVNAAKPRKSDQSVQKMIKTSNNNYRKFNAAIADAIDRYSYNKWKKHIKSDPARANTFLSCLDRVNGSYQYASFAFSLESLISDSYANAINQECFAGQVAYSEGIFIKKDKPKTTVYESVSYGLNRNSSLRASLQRNKVVGVVTTLDENNQVGYFAIFPHK